MLQRLEAIKAKLEAIEGEGLGLLREVIKDVEEAIGWHMAAIDEPTHEVKELPAGYPPITPS